MSRQADAWVRSAPNEGSRKLLVLRKSFKQRTKAKTESKTASRSLGLDGAAAYCKLKPSFLTSTASDASACLKYAAKASGVSVGWNSLPVDAMKASKSG